MTAFSSIPFSAADAWIQSVFSTATSSQCLADLPTAVGGVKLVELLTCLVGHGVLSNPLELPRLLSKVSEHGSLHRVGANFVASPDTMRADLAHSCELDLRFRQQGATLVSANVYNQTYTPPAAERAVPAVRECLKIFRFHWHRSQNVPTRFRLLLALFAVLITIHPFIDGNGRAFRALLCALSRDIPQNGPWLIIALCMLYVEDARPLTLGLKGVRSGVCESLFFEADIALTRGFSLLARDVKEIEIGLKQNALSADLLPMLTSMRSTLTGSIRAGSFLTLS